MYATNRKGDIMTANEQLASVGRNIQEKATLIWNVANTLFGAFKPHEYGLVILPMVVIKRFHDCLLPTHHAVLDTCKKVLAEEYPDIADKIHPELPDEKFRRVGQSAAAASLPEIKQ